MLEIIRISKAIVTSFWFRLRYISFNVTLVKLITFFKYLSQQINIQITNTLFLFSFNKDRSISLFPDNLSFWIFPDTLKVTRGHRHRLSKMPFYCASRIKDYCIGLPSITNCKYRSRNDILFFVSFFLFFFISYA